MTLCVRRGGKEMAMPATRLLVLAFLFVTGTAWALQAASPASSRAVPAWVARDSALCTKHAVVDACNDAIRWNPSDPSLLVALADALVRANRPADAIRHYRRAAALAPNTPGIQAKIVAAEKRLASERAPAAGRRPVQSAPHAPADPALARASASTAPGKRYSNAAPETQSH
jgi:cytochrome c-type biogenesis protein CcmH/NrfG